MADLSFGKLVRFLLILPPLAFTAIILLWLFMFFGPGGVIDQKSVYAELQGVEIEYRNQKLETPFILAPDKNREDRIAGFESDDAHFPFVWIALSRRNRDARIYMVPGDAKLRISCQRVMDFLKRNVVVANVAIFLRDQCHNNPQTEVSGAGKG